MNRTERFQVLKSPLFILGLVLLFANDFFLKEAFGNWWTGKLSDFSGLFIFPLFLTVVFPKRKIFCFLGATTLFIVWKLPLSNPLIELANNMSFPIGRTIDFSDFLAIAIIPLAYAYEKSSFSTLRINPQMVATLSAFAFIATTLPPKANMQYTNIDKTYHFDFSRDILIDRLNRLSTKKISKYRKNEKILFDSDLDLFYTTSWRDDTLAILLDADSVQQNDTIHYETVLADFLVRGNDDTSSLTFITAYKTVLALSNKDYRKRAIREFERKVIKKIR